MGARSRRSEESLFNRFATEKLGLPASQLPAFRRLALLSAEAAWRWKRGTNNSLSRRLVAGPILHCIPTLPANAPPRSPDACRSRRRDCEIRGDRGDRRDPHPARSRRPRVHAFLQPLRPASDGIWQAVKNLKANEGVDRGGTQVWLDRHDEAWADYLALATTYPGQISTFYIRNAWQTWGGENPSTAEPRIRAAVDGAAGQRW